MKLINLKWRLNMDKIFYEFNQNNSGGRFVVDDKVCNKVIIEVDTEQEADRKSVV